MECKDPIVVGKVRHKQRIVPCGKCAQCKANLRAEWCGRLSVENFNSKRSYFVTLTYADENLRCSDLGTPSVWKDDIQKFMKRMRKRISLRYFCSSEYGSTTFRPHYHIIFFLEDDIDMYKFGDLVGEVWILGRIHIGEVTPASIAYCTKYCMKDNNGYPYGANPPFRLMSKVPPLGCQITLTENSLGSFDFYGQRFKTARLYRDKFVADLEDVGLQLKIQAENRIKASNQSKFAKWCRLNGRDINDIRAKIDYGLYKKERAARLHELSLKHIKEETI